MTVKSKCFEDGEKNVNEEDFKSDHLKGFRVGTLRAPSINKSHGTSKEKKQRIKDSRESWYQLKFIRRLVKLPWTDFSK